MQTAARKLIARRSSHLEAMRLEVLQATEHALDGVAASIEDGREAILPASVRLGRDVRHRTLSLDLSADGIAVITLVAVQDRGTWHLFEQNRSRRCNRLWELRFLFGNNETPLGELLHEIYEAVQEETASARALMGIRAFFEQLMIAKVGDQGSFNANLKKFLDEGYIAKIQLTAIEHILKSRHAAIHRGYKPVEHDLNTALNIVEAITETIFFHEDEAKKVASRVPARGSRAKADMQLPPPPHLMPPSISEE